ncbi:MAG TPA: protein kinase [Polyangia bacterium]|nr:protein kinase [Polyangia bacterium]
MHPGQRIGKYVLGERIAVGGMAEVWAARAEGPEGFVKPVALKFILESFSGDADLEKLFVKEARIAAQLQHANLVSVFDFDKVVVDPERGNGGRYYIAMEHIEGHDVRRVAEAAKHAGYVFPVPLSLYLAGEVMKGLRYVHERREHGQLLGLVHRDVSPHNVLVGFSGEVKLSDFGIAKSLAHSTRTKTGTIRGKLSYASPEQLNGESVDHRTDQFAMGITLWELLAGRPLFDGNDEVEIAGKVMRCDIPPLGLINRERKIPAPVEGFVRKMLSARREERFSTTADALSALLALPGYTGDGVGLGELVRTLFHRSSLGPASTVNLPAPVRGPGARKGAGRAARAGRGAVAGELRGGEVALASEIETRTMARAAVGSGRPPTGGRDVTTAQVRGGWRRSRAAAVTLVALAGIVIIAVAISAAALHGRWGRGESSATARAPEAEPTAPAVVSPTAPASTGSQNVTPAEPMVTPSTPVPAGSELVRRQIAPRAPAEPLAVPGARVTSVPVVVVPAPRIAPTLFRQEPNAVPPSVPAAPTPAAEILAPPAAPSAKPSGTIANGAPIVE